MIDDLIEDLLHDAGDYFTYRCGMPDEGEILSWDRKEERAWEAAEALSRLNSEKVREWAAERFCSDTLLDQERRMIAAETEAFIAARSWGETSSLSEEARNAGPATTPEEWHDHKVSAMMTALSDLGIAPAWWGGTQFRQAAESLVNSQNDG